MLGLIKAKEIQFLHVLNSDQDILYSELQLGSKFKKLDSLEWQQGLAGFDSFGVI